MSKLRADITYGHCLHNNPIFIEPTLNIDTDHDLQEGKEGEGDDVLDQEVEVKVEIGHVLQTEIEEGDSEVEEDIDIF